MKLRVLDLFSGLGGFSLGLERTGGFETVAFCEYAEFPRKVLAKHWPNVPIYPDVRELTAERIHADGLGRIDLICGGYPCQPFSYAGKRNGAEDDRHLWPEMSRLISSLRPAWVIGENVAGHITMGLDDVLADLDGLGYAAQAFVIPACAVNAPHRRDRLWIVANDANGIVGEVGHKVARVYEGTHAKRAGIGEDVAHANRTVGRGRPIDEHFDDQDRPATKTGRTSIQSENRKACSSDAEQGREAMAYAFGIRGCSRDGQWQDAIDVDSCGKAVGAGSDGSWWAVEPSVGRVAHGISNRLDRLKALGNAVVPQIPEMIGHAILQSMKEAA